MNTKIKKLAGAAAVAASVFAGGISYAESDAADIAALQKAVLVCQQKVRQLEAVCPNPGLLNQPQAVRSCAVERQPGYVGYDSSASYGSAYWGFQLDN